MQKARAGGAGGVAVAMVALLISPVVGRAEPAYVPPLAGDIPGYFAGVMPCEVAKHEGTGRPYVVCKDNLLGRKSLRELAIMRNTIFARYGWDGYRKPWLRDYFHGQRWFRPNPKFTYRLLSDADRKNVHFIGVHEHAMDGEELETRRQRLLARDPAVRKLLSPEDSIEIGLLDRASGSFATDEAGRAEAEKSLDRLLSLDELRKLSLRDLRLIRNTIYARRGRTFKSPILQAHFGGLAWYKPAPAYTDKLLTANDRRNIKLVRVAEDELGGPISDEDWLIEPAIDGA